ncbi:MAG: N-methyl-L-tryptophan oxidase [Cyclobacteriaceae bacterium]|nr:N-methyl-L-tryptophan oxidase [Cyclobacteriaceae bacterium]
MPATFDVIVLGAGSMGASACYYLAKSGVKVLGIEQFGIPHEQGSHAGQSRIIRKAYFEHPDYVPLLERAYHNWKELESETSSQLYFPTGLLYAGKPGGVLIKGVKESAKKYSIQVDELNAGERAKRFPQFNIPADYEVLFEPDAGFLTPERCILSFTEQAIKSGAAIHTHEQLLEWKQDGDSISVRTNKSSYACKKLVVTTGAWTPHVLPVLQKHLTVTRQVLAWAIPKQWEQFSLEKFPCWLIDDENKPGMYYGFPVLPASQFGGPVGLKAAYHYPGQATDANFVNRNVAPAEEQELMQAVNRYLPDGFNTIHTSKTCLYTNTPDENFIIDFLPGYSNVVIAAGFSGHGFKFAPVVGEILSELSINGKTNLPVGFLNANRFQ